MKPPLILASQSPRRKELLESAGYDFQVIVPDEWAECGICTQETAPEMVARLAFQKAQNVVERIEKHQDLADNIPPQRIVVACDTLAECQGQILGKPRDPEHAAAMLRLLRGREHHVYSGLCLWRRSPEQREIAVACSQLRMDRLSDQQIDDYIATDAWIGKAGGFGYQDRIGWLTVVKVSESNIVGLPMELLHEMLQRFL